MEFNFCTNTVPIQLFSHQVGKISINLVLLFSIIYDEKEVKEQQAFQGNELFGERLKNLYKF